MPTWKKVIVSGSDISQLNNNSGYLTSATVNYPNGFATASFSGTNLLADSPTGSLNFASSSGQGLTISANAGNDTLTFGLSSIPNTSLQNSSIGGISLGGSFSTLTSGTGLTGGVYDPGSLGLTFAISGASALSTNTVTKWTGTGFANTTITDNGSVITTTTPLNVGGAITSSGDIIPSSNNTSVLGKSGNKWNSLFVENIIAQGNLTIGDSPTDTINFVSRVSSSFISNNDNAFDLGASGTRWKTLFVNSISASGAISSSAGLLGTTLTTTGAITSSGAISSSAGLLGTTLTATSNATIGGTLSVTNALTASIISASSGLTGSLFGTSSWAQSASNAVNAQTASFLPAGTYNITSSWATNALTASNITPAITNNTDNRVLTATGGGTINGESNLTFDGTTLTVTGNTVISNNLTVQGTASFQETTSLVVADRFILLASGSNTAGDGGIVVQQATQNVGEVFAWDNPSLRWGVTSSFTANQSTYTPDAFMALVISGSGTAPTSVAARYSASGNLFIGTDETIWIYS